MVSLHLPAKLASLMGLWRTAWSAAALRPFPVGNGRLNSPSPQPMPEVSAVIAFVGTQAGGSLLGASLRSGHSYLVYHLKSHDNLGHIGSSHQESQGQSITFRHQVDGAPLAFPTISDILSPFLAGTKLPSRKAWLQSNFPWASRVPKSCSQICFQIPWSCHSCKRRWQVEGLP
jgi:hypothetical protein